nr:28S ribosomal protein S22, mitochondrial [Onthophagus taurus]
MATIRCLRNHLFNRNDLKKSPLISLISLRNLNYASKEYNEKDPSPLFFNKETQSLLKTLTRINLDVVFRRRKMGQRLLSIPTQKFLTEDQLQEAMRDAENQVENIIQIPPVIKIRKPIDVIISCDPALKGLEESKMVFTDITFGLNNSERLIVIREPCGTLRHADWDTRERMNQIYFPLQGKKYRIPQMFQDIYFEDLLKRKEYKFILDKTCVQFEPDSVEYQKFTSITYQYINDNHHFDCLRSTRHFGSMCFFLVWHKIIDNLLLELIQTENVIEANVLLNLYCKIHNVRLDFKETDDLVSVEEYIAKYSEKKAPLELAVQAYKELLRERIELEKGIKRAHGVV